MIDNKIDMPLTLETVEELCKMAQEKLVTISIRIYKDGDNTDIDIEPWKVDLAEHSMTDVPSARIDTIRHP